MRYFNQLKLLIWKNWILRKRNKLRTGIEFLWPVVIFLFLILLHNLGVRKNISNCYFKPKAMPSAGELLFMQTLICTFNNTCDKYENSTMEEYNQSLLWSLGSALTEVFEAREKIGNFDERTPSERKKARHWNIEESTKRPGSGSTSDIRYFPRLARESFPREADDRKSVTDIFLLACLTHVLQSRCLTSNSTWSIQNSLFIKTEWDKGMCRRNEKCSDAEVTQELDVISKGKHAMVARALLFPSLVKYPQSGNNASDIDAVECLKFLHSLFCGARVPPLSNQIDSVLSERKKKYSFKESYRHTQSAAADWENDTTDFCNNLMKNLSSIESYKIIFGLVKPYFRGKIVYTPDAPVINALMSRINETLNKLKYVKDFVADVADANATQHASLREILLKYRNDATFLKSIVERDAGKELLKYYGKKEVGEDVESDAEAFGEIMEESAKHIEGSMADSSGIFAPFRRLFSYLECIDFDRIIPAGNEEEAVNESLKWLKNDRLAALVVFVNVSRDAVKLPPSLTYKIRTSVERTPKTTRIRDRVYVTGVKRNVLQDLKHITGGFSFLQNIIESELIREYTGRKKAPGIYLQQMPFPCHIHDSFIHVITRTLPVFMVISWCYSFGVMVKKIVSEKESHVKGTMRIFGVFTSQHWIAWFLDAYPPFLVISLILSFMLVFGNVVPNSNFFLIWLFMSTFALPTITFAFLLSIFFTKSSFALNVSMVTFFLMYLVYPPIQNFGEGIDSNLKSIACTLSNVAFGLGCTWIANMEEIGLGARFTHINYSPIPGNPITMAFVLEMFLFDSATYLLLALYLENVYRAEESVRLPWNYIFTSAYWKNIPKMKTIVVPRKHGMDESRFEAEPEDLTIGIETINLTKEYGKGRGKRRVVDNLSMKFYENQITSFLGHNGAGKTTSISMMSGLMPITSGIVLIYGVNLEDDPDIAAKDIGICRQENVLIDDLTVEEHLWLFSRLKVFQNRSPEETEKDAKEIMKDLQLEQRANSPVRNLSGGTKRKVCLAMAFIGGPRTIFLDEPTAGVDPFSRRSIWNLLTKYKKADLLGDRIAIIGNGKLQCCGSSDFLKNNFGRGYYLTIESNAATGSTPAQMYGSTETEAHRFLSSRAADFSPTVAIACWQIPDKIYAEYYRNKLNTLITGIIADARFSEEIGSEITFILPFRTEAAAYDELFTALNSRKNDMNLLSYGISNTSLAEVFFTITRQADREGDRESSAFDPSQGKSAEIPPGADDKKINSGKVIESAGMTGRALDSKIGKIITQQFFALLVKRFLHHTRNYKLLVIEVLLPAIFTAIALTLVLTLPAIQDMPPLTIDVSAYSPSLIFYKNNLPDDPIIDSYEKALLGPYGLGTKCIRSPEKCSMRTISGKDLVKEEKVKMIKNCSCHNGNYFCKISENYEEPPYAQMSSGDLLFNLTSSDLVNWLITSELNLSDTRYGGVEFGYYNVWSGLTTYDFFNLFTIKKLISVIMQVPQEGDTLFDVGILSKFPISFSYNKTYGAEIFKSINPSDNIIVWYNNRGWIAGMAFMNGVSNLVLRALLPREKNASKYGITLVNHPLPMTERQLEEDIETQINTSLLTAIAIIWALSFIPAMFAIYVVEERMSGLKLLQIVSGISKSVYWIVALFWDMTVYSLNVIAIVALFLAFDIQTYINEDGFTAFLLLLYAYGFANITFVYAVSYMFVTPSVAFIFVACYNIFVGMITLWTTFFLDLISHKDDPIYLKKIFLLFPPFCFGRGLVKMALAYNTARIMRTFGVESRIDYGAWSITSKYMVVMICLGTVFFAATVLVQFRLFPSWFLRKQIRVEEMAWPREEEGDVRKERLRVESGAARDSRDVLLVTNLTKYYPNAKTPAVDHVSFGVESGECFGLLGMNGAGKTTVFKMLTGYLPISGGDAWIGGHSLRKNVRKARSLIGYCPQGNALDPYLTCEEHLSLFCRIRGITGPKKEETINLNIQRLGLTSQRHKIVKVLSGGNKRKLNTAIALVGDPEVVLLDEPTSGMDSHSRRFVWKSIQRIVSEGRCVVLTSHNMEECQALCTKLSIMVRGVLTCFGSCQHLKSKFDDGYNVRIRIANAEASENVKKYMQEKLPKCSLIYSHYLEMRFRLVAPTPLGVAFHVLNQAKTDKLIHDYSLSQTTLENVFLRVARSSETTGATTSTFRSLESFCCNLWK